MGWEFVSRRFATELAEFLTDSGIRWSDALKKVAAGTYNTGEFKADINDSISGSVDVWATLLSSPSSEFLPVARLGGSVAELQSPTGIKAVVVPEEPIPAAATLKTPSTAVMEGAPSKQVDCTVQDSGGAYHDKITVSVKLPATAPAPDPGVYHGAVRVDEGGTVKIIAAILLTIT